MDRKKYAFCLFLFSIATLVFVSSRAEAADPISLDDYVRLVVANNRTLQSQAKSVEAAYYAVRSSVAYQRPSLSVTADGTYLSGQETLGRKENNITAFDTGVILGQGIDISGVYGLDEQQQILYYEIQAASYQDTFNTLVSQAMEAYYSAMYARDNVLLQNEILVQRRENLRVTDEKYKVGTVQKLDVIRAEAQVTEAESYIVQAETDYNNLLATMKDMAGGREIAIVDTPLDLPPLDYSVDYDTALAKRPDIRVYRISRERALVVKKLNAKGLSPTLAAGLNWVPYADPWNFTTIQDGEVSVGLTLNVPIFDGNATKYNTLGADRLLQSAEAALEAAYSNTSKQLTTTKNNLEKAISVERYMKRQMTSTAEELRITRVRYLEGVGDQLDLLNAFTADQLSRTNHLGAIRDIYIALVELRKAMGDYAPDALDGSWRTAVQEFGKGK